VPARVTPLIDVAPTVAALLGVPGARPRGEAARWSRCSAVARRTPRAARPPPARGAALAAILDAARAERTTPEPGRLALALAGIALAIGLARGFGRRGALTIAGPGALVGAAGFAAMLLAAAAATRGTMSPSYIPSLARVIPLGAVAIVAAIALQVTACARAIRRAGDRIAASNGVALVRQRPSRRGVA
jgi:hypothetical protein